jgi:hypothetical protein
MDLENASGRMEDHTKETMLGVKNRGMEFTHFQMENNTKETGFLETSMAMGR